jgi:hypothetical protein
VEKKKKEINISQPSNNKIVSSDAPKKNAPVVCKTTKNRGLFFIEPPKQAFPSRALPKSKQSIPNLGCSKSILKTVTSKTRTSTKLLKFRRTYDVREFDPLYDNILQDEEYSSSKEITKFDEDIGLSAEPVSSSSARQTLPTDPRIDDSHEKTRPIVPENFEQNIKNQLDQILTHMLKWNCDWLDGPEEQEQLMPRSSLRPMLCRYTSFNEYSRYACFEFRSLKYD